MSYAAACRNQQIHNPSCEFGDAQRTATNRVISKCIGSV
jgi:hypothetical protein